MKSRFVWLGCLMAGFFSGFDADSVVGQENPVANPAFARYWHQGKAEINRFELEQVRYGEVRKGDAVLVFVTEDFLPKEQVKADSVDREKSGAWPILKLNFTRNFTTGIYPYSVMTSIFTPVEIAEHPRSLKCTTSMQEWCGHVFSQINLRGRSYEFQTYSYFQSEGDRRFKLEAVWLEDELWTRIRLDPRSLPEGKIRIIPGGTEQRFSHRSFRVEDAVASRSRGKGRIVNYSLKYNQSGRELVISFQADFPHRIEAWTDRSGPGREATRAKRTHTLMDDYWNHNSNRDRDMRKQIGLDDGERIDES